MEAVAEERLCAIEDEIATHKSRAKALQLLWQRTRSCTAFTIEECDTIQAALDKEERDVRLKEDELSRMREFFETTVLKFDSDVRVRQELLNELFDSEELRDHQDLMSIFADRQLFLQQTISQVCQE